jgi:hypothetical protein
VKKHLEESGHEVPIFETGDFGTWEKDTLTQCLDVVRSSDVFILLINKKSGANSKLMNGNVTPTYLEYKAALQTRKHILVFVSPDVKRGFDFISPELKKLYETYLHDNHRTPDSPFDPFKDWIGNQINNDGIAKQILTKADPFVWAFLYEVYNNREWVYDFDISETEKNAWKISQMLSTSLRSVVSLIAEREQIEELKGQASYLLNFADYTLTMLIEKNNIMYNRYANQENKKELWSDFLEQGIIFLKQPKDIIQAPDFNPVIVNKIADCYAASLYLYDEKQGELLTLVGTTGEITAPEVYTLEEGCDFFVVDAFNKEERIISFREDKQTIYLTEPIGDFVLCLHFLLDKKWTEENVKAYVEEIERAIIKENDYFFEYLKLLIGGRT